MTTTMRGRLIGLYSPVPRCGKSTVARMLVTSGFRKMPIAGPLKCMLKSFLRDLQLRDYEVRHYLEDEKAAKIPGVGVSCRHLMQTLGTEWGRECIDPDIWVRMWAEKVEDLLSSGFSVVCDDVRFVNEAERLAGMGGELWFIRRNEPELGWRHASEGGLNEFPFFDRHIENSGSIQALESHVRNLLKSPSKVAA